MPPRDVAGQGGRAAGSALRVDVAKPGTVLMHSGTSANLARARACRPLGRQKASVVTGTAAKPPELKSHSHADQLKFAHLRTLMRP